MKVAHTIANVRATERDAVWIELPRSDLASGNWWDPGIAIYLWPESAKRLHKMLGESLKEMEEAGVILEAGE